MDDDFQIGDLVIFVDAAFDNRYGIEKDDSLGIIIYNKGATATLAMVYWVDKNQSVWCWKKNLEKISKWNKNRNTGSI